MAKTKKIILFLVEGVTDKESIALILSKIINTEEVFFEITGGDITSRYGIGSGNAKKVVWEYIKTFMSKNRYQKSDIIKIIHLLDTDGAFIPDEHVKNSADGGLYYHDDYIEAGNIEKIRKRNRQKTEVIKCLSTTSKLGNISYQAFYFSRNLEHVLHNIGTEVSRDEKIKMADEFVDQYEMEPEKFIEFMQQKELLADIDYKSSWEYIYQGIHSLKRKCNFGLFFS